MTPTHTTHARARTQTITCSKTLRDELFLVMCEPQIEPALTSTEAAQATERDPEAEAQEWWCTDDAGEYVGPLTPPELRELHAGGALAADALFFTEGMEEWLPLADVAAALGM